MKIKKCKFCNDLLQTIKEQAVSWKPYECINCKYYLFICTNTKRIVEQFNIEKMINGKVEELEVIIDKVSSTINYADSTLTPIAKYNYQLKIKNLDDLNKVVDDAIRLACLK